MITSQGMGFNGAAEGIRLLAFHDINYPNENYFEVFRQLLVAAQYAAYAGCRDILELGAGLSTVVWDDYLERVDGGRLTSVDVSFDRVKAVCVRAPRWRRLERRVDFICGKTMGEEELRKFYLQPQSRIAGVNVAVLKPYVAWFVNRQCHADWWRKIQGFLDACAWRIDERLIGAQGLVFPRELLDAYAAGHAFDKEMESLARLPASVMGHLQQRQWDCIFFDTGEFSSLPEWNSLCACVRCGGLAVFHDIFFPKSLKNFIACASVCAHPDWEVLYQDHALKQGMLIARRVR